MRRSVREALVGFSLLAAIVSGVGFWFWLRGISLRRDTWMIRASFSDAAGLADRSPVSFRGVLVGNVRRITVTDSAVLADLEITDPRLRLSRPTVAQVGTGSLLGGDAVVSLMSAGQPLPAAAPGPRDKQCDDQRMVCHNGKVRGVVAASLNSVTDTVQRMLDIAERDGLVPQMVAATQNFEQSAGRADQFMQDGQVFIREAQSLLQELKLSVRKTDPILANLDRASADAAATTAHVRNLAAALDNPRTVAELEATLSNARRLTAQWEAVGGDVNKLTGDEQFMNSLRDVTVGLGKFFEELYPAQTDAARARAARQRPTQAAPARQVPAAPRSR